MDNLKDTIIIYHGDCPDGFGAAYAAWKKFGNTATYLPWKDHDTLPAGLTDKTIYIVDFSFPRTLLELLVAANSLVVVIDHHISAEADVIAFPQNVFDLNHSGCVLAWHYFHPGTPIPLVLQYVEDNDIWRNVLPEYREFKIALDQYPMTFETWDNLNTSLKNENNLINFIAKGAILAKYEDKLVASMIAGRELVSFEGHTVYAVNTNRNFRDLVGNQLALMNEDEGRTAFGIVYYHKSGVITMSLRSHGDVDVSKMAQKYGGGGHKNASAIRVNSFAELPFTFIDSK
jgi:oligoribonuclease NrnB/cAMP/cGMP phosphodiesterase (DHH superfamily)